MGLGKSYTGTEDEILAEQWVIASEDPIAGTDRTKETFFKAVAEGYNKAIEKLNVHVECYAVRDWSGLASRWAVVKQQVGKFIHCVHLVESFKISGNSDQDNYNAAVKLFFQNGKNDTKGLEKDKEKVGSRSSSFYSLSRLTLFVISI